MHVSFIRHTLPSSLEQSDLKDEDYVRSLGSGVPIMLYLHGNAGTRLVHHVLCFLSYIFEGY